MLFSLKKYFECNEIQNITVFDWPSTEAPQVQIYFSLNQNTAKSLPKTPYAGFQFHKPLTENEMVTMISELLIFFRDNQLEVITIKQSPSFYNTNDNILHNTLTRFGFNFTSEINHHIDTSPWKDDFSSMQKRKVNKCITEGLVFSSELSLSHQELHDFITKCRMQQNLEVNVSVMQFSKLLTELPDHFQVYTVTNSLNKLLACLVSIQVNEKVDYSFLPAFDRDFSRLSPLAFLFYNYFKTASTSSTEIVDLGISSINGLPQEGLIHFKEAIGGIRTERMIYELKL